MHNNEQKERAFVIVVEIRNGDGVTTYLSWQSGIIEVNGNYTMETVWTPTVGQGGSNYEIRCFAITDFENPRVLSSVYSTGRIITVFESRYTILMENKSFEIPYSLAEGKEGIVDIKTDFERFNISMEITGVERDSTTTMQIYLPMEMLKEMEIASGYHYCVGNEFVVFVGNENVAATQKDTSTHEILTFPVKGGAETVYIAGTDTLIEPPRCD